MVLVVALVVFGATFGLAYWQLRGDHAASTWVVAGLAVAAAIVGLVLGSLFGAFAVFVIGVIAAAVLVFGYRWYAARRRSGHATGSTAGGGPVSASTPPEKVCPDCAELVKRDARVCRYCGHRFEEGQDEPQAPAMAPEPEASAVRDEPEPVAAPAEAIVGATESAAPATVEAGDAVTPAASGPSPEPSGDPARFCARCGQEFEDDARFCGTCGAPRP